MKTFLKGETNMDIGNLNSKARSPKPIFAT